MRDKLIKALAAVGGCVIDFMDSVLPVLVMAVVMFVFVLLGAAAVALIYWMIWGLVNSFIVSLLALFGECLIISIFVYCLSYL